MAEQKTALPCGCIVREVSPAADPGKPGPRVMVQVKAEASSLPWGDGDRGLCRGCGAGRGAAAALQWVSAMACRWSQVFDAATSTVSPVR